MVPVICYILTLLNFKRKLPIGHCLRDVSGLFLSYTFFFWFLSMEMDWFRSNNRTGQPSGNETFPSTMYILFLSHPNLVKISFIIPDSKNNC